MTSGESVFTTSHGIQERKLAENDLSWAFLTNIPITPGHSLIVPKRVVETIEELTSDEISDIFALLTIVKSALRKTYGAEGFNYAWNEGADYGQSVPHFHLHVVPRTKNDDGIVEYDPRQFLYRPGSRELTPENELAAMALELRNNIRD